MSVEGESRIPYTRFSVVLTNLEGQSNVPEGHTPIYFNLHTGEDRNPKIIQVLTLGRDFIEDIMNTLLEIVKEDGYEDFKPSSLTEAIFVDLGKKKKKLWKREGRLSPIRIKIGATFWGNELNLEIVISCEDRKVQQELETRLSTRFDTLKYSKTIYGLSFISSSVKSPYAYTSVSHVSIQAIASRYIKKGDKILFSTTSKPEK
ncbi:MAG: hypothetical protein ACFFCQ_11395 [Promethearchaeota archaeon]